MPKKSSLCFVCTGNTCRSPMAHFVLKSKVSAVDGMELKITSFGTSVTEETINPLAKNTLKMHKIKMTKFVPKQISLEKAKGFDAIIAMTDSMMNKLKKEGYQNVYSMNQLTKVGDISDPYGKTQRAYDNCYEQINTACDELVRMLKKVL